MPDTTELETILLDIVAAETGAPVDDATAGTVREILFEAGMDTDAEVPAWITTFFTALRDRAPLPVSEQPASTTDAAVSEFFYDLQQLPALDCYDHGEWVRVRLPNHGMLGVYSIQYAYYTVVPLSEIDDSGDSDLSAAKIHPGRAD